MSALFAAALKFNFFSFFFLVSKQKSLSFLVKVWLLCTTLSILSSITDLTSHRRPRSRRTRCSFILQTLTFTRTVRGRRNFKRPICRSRSAHSPVWQGACTFICTAQHISLNRFPSLSRHKQKTSGRTQAAPAWLHRIFPETAERSGPESSLWNCFLFYSNLQKKKKSTTEINTLCSARNCGVVSTSCMSNEVAGGGAEPLGVGGGAQGQQQCKQSFL